MAEKPSLRSSSSYGNPQGREVDSNHPTPASDGHFLRKSGNLNPDISELRRLQLVRSITTHARTGVIGGARASTSVDESIALDSWAKRDPDHSTERQEFVKQVKMQLARESNLNGVISMTFATRAGIDAISIDAYKDLPPLPSRVTAIFVPSNEMKRTFDAQKEHDTDPHNPRAAIAQHVSIHVLPREMVDQCWNASLWECEPIDEFICAKDPSPHVVEQLPLYKAWQRKSDDNRAISARINVAAISNQSTLTISDLRVTGDPPPLLPPCIKEVRVPDEESAQAYKARHPGLTILCG